MAASGTYRTASGRGVAELLVSLGDHAVVDLGAELYQEGQGIITQAQGLVPVEYGTLRASGYVAEPERIGDKVRVEMGFGGAAAPYAVIVHEDLNAFHDDGEALYLEQPFRWAQSGMADRIAAGLRARLFGRYATAMSSAMGEA